MITKEEVFSNMAIKQDAGVPFNRTNPVPLDKHSIFASKTDAVSYATLSATAYPGQVIAINEDEVATFAASLSVSSEVTSIITLPSYNLNFVDEGDEGVSYWDIEFSNGFTYNGYFQVYDPKQEIWLTSGTNTSSDLSIRFSTEAGNLKIPIDPTTTGEVIVTFTRESTAVNTWNLYVIDPSAPNNLKKIEGGSGSGGSSAGSGDVEAETARAKAAEQALSNSITALTLSTDQISTVVEGLTGTLDNYQPVSSMTAYQEVTGMTAYQEVTGMTAYQTTADMTAYVKHDDLADANAGGLSNASATNPIMLSSDLSALAQKAIVLKGSVATSADLPSADVKVGDMYIIIGNGADAGAEYVCTKDDPLTWGELGREGTIAAIATYVDSLSNTIIPGITSDIKTLSDGLGTVSTNLNTVSTDLDTAETKIEELTANVNTLSNTTIPEICASISNAVTSVSGDLTSISSDIYADGTGLSAQVTSISSSVETAKTDIAGLKTDVETISTDIYKEGGISSQISTMSSDISSLSDAVGSLADDQVSVKIDDLSSTELNVKHINEADYHQLVIDGTTDPKTIYIVSADGYQNMYDERIINLSTLSTEAGDAANVGFVTAYVDGQIATITTDIGGMQEDIDKMISAIRIEKADGTFISAEVENSIATISALSVSDLKWDIDVINGGDSGVQQA